AKRGGTRLRRHHVVVVVPAPGGKAAVDQARAQAVLFARLARLVLNAHGSSPSAWLRTGAGIEAGRRGRWAPPAAGERGADPQVTTTSAWGCGLWVGMCLLQKATRLATHSFRAFRFESACARLLQQRPGVAGVPPQLATHLQILYKRSGPMLGSSKWST